MEVILQCLSFFKRAQLIQLQLATLEIHSIIQNNFSKTPYVLIKKLQYFGFSKQWIISNSSKNLNQFYPALLNDLLKHKFVRITNTLQGVHFISHLFFQTLIHLILIFFYHIYTHFVARARENLMVINR